MRLICLRGVPGCGKSTMAQSINKDGEFVIVSADDFFIVNGEYRFDPSKLSEAHGACFRKAIEALQAGRSVLVDNTCITAAEIAPYLLAAQAYGAEGSVQTLLVDPVVAAARNTHGVPEHAVLRMDASLRREGLPPWWVHTVSGQ